MVYGLKVLDKNMRSRNGGTQIWELNKTVRVEGKIVMCENGLHMTFKPEMWRKENSDRVFICRTPKVYASEFEKAICREMTLVYEMSKRDLKAYEDGEAALWKAYKDGKAALWKAYEDGEAALWKAYKDGEAPLLKAYKDGVQKILKGFIQKDHI